MSQARTSYEQELVRAARTVARLEAARSGLKRRLAEVNGKLRMERKVLKGLATVSRQPNVMPSRLTGGATGHVMPPKVVNDARPSTEATDLFMAAFEEDGPPENAAAVIAAVRQQPTKKRRKRRRAKR